jgi:uncharacterized protein YtpQ (UPF0354 family)
MGADTIISLEAFTDEVVERCFREAPERKIAVIGQGQLLVVRGERRQKSSLVNKYNEYKASPDRFEDCIHSLVELLVKQEGPIKAGADLSNVMPIFRSREFLDEAIEFSKRNGGKVPDLYEQWPGDIVKIYAIDGAHSLSTLLHTTELVELGCTVEELYQAAEANISKLAQKFNILKGDDMFMFTYDGTYETSLLAATEFWRSNRLQLRGNALVYCPTRDVLIVADGASKAAEARLFEMASDPTPPPGGYAISRQIMQFRLGKFHLYQKR